MNRRIFRDISRKIQKKMKAAASETLDFIDSEIIDKKFQDNFPGHRLTAYTIRRKKRNKELIGQRSGYMRRMAIDRKNWVLISSENLVLEYRKRKWDITRYANFVRTNEGGGLDFLGLSASDQQKIDRFILRACRREGLD